MRGKSLKFNTSWPGDFLKPDSTEHIFLIDVHHYNVDYNLFFPIEIRGLNNKGSK